jgi:hypothetical protein
MFSQIKVGKFSVKTWWIIFLCLQVSLLALMITTCAVYPWVTSNWTRTSFRGDLSWCRKGCYSSYANYKSVFCQDAPYSFLVNVYSSYCKLFKSLYTGLIIFVLFEILSMIGIVLWAIFMLISVKRIKFLKATYFCSGSAFFCHLIAIFGWLGVTRPDFGGECYYFPSDGSLPAICGSAGPILGIIVLCIMPIVVISYIVVACNANLKKILENPNSKSEEGQSVEINNNVVGKSNNADPEKSLYTPNIIIPSQAKDPELNSLNQPS